MCGAWMVAGGEKCRLNLRGECWGSGRVRRVEEKSYNIQARDSRYYLGYTKKEACGITIGRGGL